jgi:hypothetical protein
MGCDGNLFIVIGGVDGFRTREIEIERARVRERESEE